MTLTPILRIAGYIQDSLCDGPGLRLTIFLQGCDIKCPGCHNPESHDPAGGYEISVAKALSLATPITTGITISGGEPTMQWEAVRELAKLSPLPIMIYSGRTLEEFSKYQIEDQMTLFKLGPYIQAKRSLVKQYGSTNQRIYTRKEMLECV